MMDDLTPLEINQAPGIYWHSQQHHEYYWTPDKQSGQGTLKSLLYCLLQASITYLHDHIITEPTLPSTR